MKRALPLLPFALFLIVLPFPGTVAMRMLLLAICFGIALWQWWRVPGARAAIPCRKTLLAWAAVCVASLAYSVDATYSAGELKNELGYTMMAFFSFFVIAADRSAAIRLGRALGAGLALIGLWATLSWARAGYAWDHGGRAGGIGIFATYLVTIAPVLAWSAAEDPQPGMRRAAVGLLLFGAFLAVISMQRAAMPALAGEALILLGYAFRRRLGSWRTKAAVAVAVAAISAAGLLFIHHVRYSGPGAAEGLADDVRFAFWPSVIAKIGEHPLLGAGFGQQAMQKAYPELIPPDVPLLWHAHNLLLNYGLQLGLPGMIALLALFATFANLFWRAARRGSGWVGVAGLALIAGVLLRNQFNDFFLRDMSLLFWALMGIFARLATMAPQGNSDDEQTPA